MLNSNEIYQKFIQFFQKHHHLLVPSSSLIPANDPTILFTNAGMNQFKDYFLGNSSPESPCIVTCQKVMRAGGKHNDLENVGKTPRHHTFFEMLGNFSFGNYFKEEAIGYAWNFLLNILNINPSRLAVSVFQNDSESYQIWHDKIGVPENRIACLGEKDNFWSMGDLGPCGPCSEIHYDLLPDQNKSPKNSLEEGEERFLEIWNLVFMEFNKNKDASLSPLPNRCVDTGMGLERITSVIQGVPTNYKTDIFQPLLKLIKNQISHQTNSHTENIACNIIADHLRAVVFLIADHVIPSNEGRGYVLRRIIRRAARYGKNLDFHTGFFANLVTDFIPMVTYRYPKILEQHDLIKNLINQEEQRFSATLNYGGKLLDQLITEYQKQKKTLINGYDIFKLYDTYGFPVDLTRDILQDYQMDYDHIAFEKALQEQKQRAKSAQNKIHDLKIHSIYLELQEKYIKNQFVGYHDFQITTNLLAILKEQQIVNKIYKNDLIEILLEQTPFYPEGGGQISDQGEIIHDDFIIQILETKKVTDNLILSKGKVISIKADSATIEDGLKVQAKINFKIRQATTCNHTATHLLQAAIQEVLGTHVKQSGSFVNHERLRFDFNHFAPVTNEEIQKIESIVNQQIQLNHSLEIQEMGYQEAIENGALGLFGEKYGKTVRVVKINNFSQELCGGCHVLRTGEIGFFAIAQETSVAAGIRRIEAITADKAIQYYQDNLEKLHNIAQKLKVPLTEILTRIESQIEQLQNKDLQITTLQNQQQEFIAEKLIKSTEKIKNVTLIISKIDPTIDLKKMAPFLIHKISSGMVLLCQQNSADKISVILSISNDLLNEFNANTLIKELSPFINGRGGGKPEIAQCGGSQPAGWELLKNHFKKILND